MRIALLGTRGIPANYGGFETFAEELSARLVERGHSVTVFARRHHARDGIDEWRGAKIRVLPAIKLKALDTLSHTFLSCLDVKKADFDVVLLCNAANAPFIPVLHHRGLRVILNVDGIERKRKKWGKAGRLYYLWCERLAARWADTLVTDAKVIERYYRRLWRRHSHMIPYGGDVQPPSGHRTLDQFSLVPGEYFLYVSRFEPENNPDKVIEAYRSVKGERKLVMVGGAPYAPALRQRIDRMAAEDPRIVLTGFVYGCGYRELLFNARAYIHATEVGGTHPALVEALGAGRIVFFLDNQPNREVVERAGIPFVFTGEASLETVLQSFEDNPNVFFPLGNAAKERVNALYRWDAVTDAYERLLEAAC